MKKFLAILLLAAATLSAYALEAYPNEISGFELFSASPYAAILPLVSDFSDVRRILGEPKDVRDLEAYVDPYPGDLHAKSPIFRYSYNDDWDVIIYFVSSSNVRKKFPISFLNKVYSIDFIPKKRIRVTPSTDIFQKKGVIAADAAWDEFSDSYGLCYSVYRSNTLYGNKQSGDLNRISYRAADSAIQRAQESAVVKP